MAFPGYTYYIVPTANKADLIKAALGHFHSEEGLGKGRVRGGERASPGQTIAQIRQEASLVRFNGTFTKAVVEVRNGSSLPDFPAGAVRFTSSAACRAALEADRSFE
tara:strand:+ start:3774 stop:4094 length:321 start_codon:yes stop_codon:yes gene_type:complete